MKHSKHRAAVVTLVKCIHMLSVNICALALLSLQGALIMLATGTPCLHQSASQQENGERMQKRSGKYMRYVYVCVEEGEGTSDF